ncbi:MAG: hypothetical protein AAGF76_14000, partial [Pseudomonadota bacterium]
GFCVQHAKRPVELTKRGSNAARECVLSATRRETRSIATGVRKRASLRARHSVLRIPPTERELGQPAGLRRERLDDGASAPSTFLNIER